MRRLARKKIVFVIVEGVSDETALGIALSQIFDEKSVYVHIMRGDITSRNGVNASNIIAKIGNEVRKYAKSYHFSAKDFEKIIHIVDTDGVYIPEEAVIEEQICSDIHYESDGIHTANRVETLRRNRQKTENLGKLRSTGQIWKIPYNVYYMSCNLDHVLHNKRNNTEADKEKDAYAFAKKYNNHVDDFVQFLCHSSFSVNGDYRESWIYIENEMNSIERFTNLGICIMEEIEKRCT